MSDARWALIEPTLTAWRTARRGPGTVPPCTTVYDYYAKWEADGTTETLHDLLRQQVRVTKGRATTPSAAIIDSQSVKPPAMSAKPAKGIDEADGVG